MPLPNSAAAPAATPKRTASHIGSPRDEGQNITGQQREKGGKRHAMPCHNNLEEYLTAYLAGAGLRDDRKGPLFRTIGRGTVITRAGAEALSRSSKRLVSRNGARWLTAKVSSKPSSDKR